MTKRRKAANGTGSFGRGSDNVAWQRCCLPRKSGEKLVRKRVPIEGSDKMNDGDARKAGVKLARDIRDGKIVLDVAPQPITTLTGPASDWSTVRQLGGSWTGKPTAHKPDPKPPMFERFGRVAKLRLKAGAYIDKVTLEAHVYGTKTRGPD